MLFLIVRLLRKSKTMLLLNAVPYIITLLLFISLFVVDNAYAISLMGEVINESDIDIKIAGYLNQTQPVNISTIGLNENQTDIIDCQILSVIVFPAESYYNWFGFISGNSSYFVKHDNITVLVADDVFYSRYFNNSSPLPPIMISEQLYQFLVTEANFSLSINELSSLSFVSFNFNHNKLYYTSFNITSSFLSFDLIPSPLLDILDYFSRQNITNITRRLLIVPVEFLDLCQTVQWLNYYNSSDSLIGSIHFKQIFSSFYHFNRSAFNSYLSFNKLEFTINQLQNQWYSEIYIPQQEILPFQPNVQTYFYNHLTRRFQVASNAYKSFFGDLLFFSFPLLLLAYIYTAQGFNWLFSSTIKEMVNLLLLKGASKKSIHRSVILLITIIDLSALAVVIFGTVIIASFISELSLLRQVATIIYTIILSVFFYVTKLRDMNRMLSTIKLARKTSPQQDIDRYLKHRTTARIIGTVILMLITAIILGLIVLINRFIVLPKQFLAISVFIIASFWWISLFIACVRYFLQIFPKSLQLFFRNFTLLQLTIKNLTYVVRKKIKNHTSLILILVAFYLSASIFASYENQRTSINANILGDVVVAIDNSDLNIYNEIITHPNVSDYLPIIRYTDLLLLEENIDFYATNFSKLSSFFSFNINELDVISFFQFAKIKHLSDTNKAIMSGNLDADTLLHLGDSVTLIRARQNGTSTFTNYILSSRIRKIPFFSNVSLYWILGDYNPEMLTDTNAELLVALKLRENQNLNSFIQMLQSSFFADHLTIYSGNDETSHEDSTQYVQKYWHISLIMEGIITLLYISGTSLLWRNNVQSWSFIVLSRGGKRNTLKFQILSVFLFYMLLILGAAMALSRLGIEIFLYTTNTLTSTWYTKTRLPPILNFFLICGLAFSVLFLMLHKYNTQTAKIN